VILILGLASGAQALWAGDLEVVTPPQAQRKVLRDQEQIVPMTIRNRGTAPVALTKAYLEWEDEKASPTPPKVPVVIGLDHVTLAAGKTTSIGLLVPAYSGIGKFAVVLRVVLTQEPPQTEILDRFVLEVEEPPTTGLTSKGSGWIAALLGLIVLGLTVWARVTVEKDGKKQKWNFFQSPDGSYSVSRFQVWLWTVVIICSYAYLFFRQGAPPNMPDSIWALLGISLGSIGAATAMAARRDPDPPPVTTDDATKAVVPAVRQSPLASMLSEDGKPSVARLQMFAWTIATAIFFVFRLYDSGQLWDVPQNLLILMGISHAAYLADKAAQK
jgi:hypothetical protein